MRPEHQLLLLLQLHAKGLPLPPLSPHGPMSTCLLDLGPSLGLNRIFAGFLNDKSLFPLWMRTGDVFRVTPLSHLRGLFAQRVEHLVIARDSQSHSYDLQITAYRELHSHAERQLNLEGDPSWYTGLEVSSSSAVRSAWTSPEYRALLGGLPLLAEPGYARRPQGVEVACQTDIHIGVHGIPRPVSPPTTRKLLSRTTLIHISRSVLKPSYSLYFERTLILRLLSHTLVLYGGVISMFRILIPVCFSGPRSGALFPSWSRFRRWPYLSPGPRRPLALICVTELLVPFIYIIRPCLSSSRRWRLPGCCWGIDYSDLLQAWAFAVRRSSCSECLPWAFPSGVRCSCSAR